MNNPSTEKEVVIGNVYGKYSTGNPLFKFLVENYLKSLDELVSLIDPISIHEVGCGEGSIISRYVNDKRKLTATDFSTKIIAEAQNNFGSLNIDFHATSIYDLNIKDQAECVLCCEVLEHLVDPLKALEKLYTISNPYLIISVPREPLWRVLNVLGGAYWNDLGNTPGHLQHWSKKNIVKFISNKFKVELIKSPLPWTMLLCKKDV